MVNGMERGSGAATAETAFLVGPEGRRIAYHRLPGRAPGVMFLGGYASDMTGTKASALEAFCRARGQAFLRFDYSGHGRSSGDFRDGTIGRWTADALAAFDRATEGPQILVGSSMGGWIMLLVARARAERIAGLVGVAAAPDFTEDLMWARMTPAARAELAHTGVILEPSRYDERPYEITRALIEDGRRHLLLRQPLPLAAPLRLLHGMGDADVPWQTALRILERYAGRDATVTLVKDGDHRLSRPQDLARIEAAIAELSTAPAGDQPRASAASPLR